MSPTIGAVANVYNEANALPGWIESALSWADWVGVMHAGPRGEVSNDGTIDILDRWSIPTEYCAIDAGFGEVRTRTLRMCPCDYVVLLDADERFFPAQAMMTCDGESTPQSEVDAILQTYDFRDVRTVLPNWENVARLGADLLVVRGQVYDQLGHLRDLLKTRRPDAVATIRRHWHDLSFTRPTQNWHTDPDWQMRLVRNDPSIYFDPATRMHERLVGAFHIERSSPVYGPFFDHFHFTFKRMEQVQRAHDVAIYDKIHRGEVPPTLEEFDK